VPRLRSISIDSDNRGVRSPAGDRRARVTLLITQLAEALGAEISGVDLARAISASDFAAIPRGMARAPGRCAAAGQTLSDPELKAFSARFGELDSAGTNPYGKPFLPDHPEMNVISNIKVDGMPIAAWGDARRSGTPDMTYVERPPMASILYALEVPPSGGDTYWANMCLAYDTLPMELKKSIAERRAVHDATYNSAGLMRKGYGEVTDPRKARRGAIHWCGIHPETGRKSLFLGRRRKQLYRGSRDGGERAAARRAMGARHAAAFHLPAAMAHGRRRRVGQPLHAAPAAMPSTRRRGACSTARRSSPPNKPPQRLDAIAVERRSRAARAARPSARAAMPCFHRSKSSTSST